MERSWDDLRFLLALYRSGNLTAAARALGVDQTTVTRRMRSLEDKREAKLFDRLRGGIMLTPAGEAFCRAAEDIEARVLEVERTVTGNDSELTGPVRLTLPQTLAMTWIQPLEAFARKHPQVSLELVVDDEFRSLSRREADVAIRYVKAPPEHLVGRRLSRVALAVYGATKFRDTPVGELPWIGWEPGLKDSYIARYHQRFSPHQPFAFYANSMLVILEALHRGLGVTVLGCVTGDADPQLVRLSKPELGETPLWLLTHPDLQRSARVRALMKHVADFVLKDRSALRGETPAEQGDV